MSTVINLRGAFRTRTEQLEIHEPTITLGQLYDKVKEYQLGSLTNNTTDDIYVYQPPHTPVICRDVHGLHDRLVDMWNLPEHLESYRRDRSRLRAASIDLVDLRVFRDTSNALHIIVRELVPEYRGVRFQLRKDNQSTLHTASNVRGNCPLWDIFRQTQPGHPSEQEFEFFKVKAGERNSAMDAGHMVVVHSSQHLSSLWPFNVDPDAEAHFVVCHVDEERCHPSGLPSTSNDFSKRVRRVSSEDSTPAQFLRGQNTARIEIGRPVWLDGRISASMMHPALAKFAHALSNAEPIRECHEHFEDLCTRMNSQFPSEDQRNIAFRQWMRNMGTFNTTPGQVDVFVLWRRIQLKHTLGENTLEVGASTSVSKSQLATYYWFAIDECKRPLGKIGKNTNFPMLLLVNAGAFIEVAVGVLYHGTPIIETLLSIPVQAHQNNETAMLQGRFVSSLQSLTQDLNDYYSKSSLFDNLDNQPDFPFLKSYIKDGTISYALHYNSLLFEGKLVFSAIVTTSTLAPMPVVVKYTRRFSEGAEAAHQISAGRGEAPILHHVERLYGWSILIMEDLCSRTYLAVDSERHSQVADIIKNKLKNALDSLHKEGFVHGDVRCGNIMYCHRTQAIALVDFDWAGAIGKATYPLAMNRDVPRVDGVRPGVLIEEQHDLGAIELVLNLSPSPRIGRNRHLFSPTSIPSSMVLYYPYIQLSDLGSGSWPWL